jgi:hypothetical protein
MKSGHDAGLRTVGDRPGAVGWRKVLSWLFAREAVTIETVATRVHFEVSPETAWNLIMFYEEVPGRPPFLLRTFLPYPVRTEGTKTSVGARIRCIYRGGDLIKHVTAIEQPCLIQFEVTDQRLGIEGCVVARDGSYAIERNGDGADIVLTTRYSAYLHPRLLWSPLEKLVTGQLHHHVLNGMRNSLSEIPCDVGLSVESLRSASVTEGGLACTALQSPSRH